MAAHTASSASTSTLRALPLAALTLQDEASFAHVGLYADLKARLLADDYHVTVLPERAQRWDHALLLNLSFWDASGGGDVLVDEGLPADVLCHMAWHHLAAGALGPPGQPLSAPAMLLGESIASAFDLYLVGRLLGHAPDSDFLHSQLPAMADAAANAGVDADAFAAMLDDVRADPEAAFEALRRLIFDVSLALLSAENADQALAALLRFEDAPYACLLHHFELSSWLQHARAAPDNDSSTRAHALDQALRLAPVALDWLADHWELSPPTAPWVAAPRPNSR